MYRSNLPQVANVTLQPTFSSKRPGRMNQQKFHFLTLGEDVIWSVLMRGSCWVSIKMTQIVFMLFPFTYRYFPNQKKTCNKSQNKTANKPLPNSDFVYMTNPKCWRKNRRIKDPKEITAIRACLDGGGEPQAGEVTHLSGVTRLSV